MVTRIFKYVTALLALWLIVAVSVFSTGAAIWIAFATAVAITGLAAADLALSVVKGRWLAVGAAATVIALSAALIVSSLIFEDASLGWLMAIGGGAIMLVSLGEAGLPRRAVAREVGLYEFPRAEERAAV